MNVIIPMGGIGSRFQRNGYRHPKPLINIAGRPMILWLIDNLKLTAQDTIFLGVHTHIEEEFQLSELIRRELPSGKAPTIKCTKLYFDTRGAAETLYIIVENMLPEEKERKTISLDCDTIYFTDILALFRRLPAGESACFYFEDTQDKPVFSYIDLDAEDRIVSIREKHKISPHANTGAYAFASARLLEQFCCHVLDNGVGSTGEYYTSNVIAKMIEANQIFRGIFVKDFACVGTPWQLEEFLKYIRRNPQLVKARRFCFDLDNTLVTMPTVSGDYSTVQPKIRNIQLVQQLKECGHHIIIHTARRMKTHNGNVGSILADVGMVTLETLKRFQIPCDEIHFGKPYAHVYVDDLAVNALLDTEKELGWNSNTESMVDMNLSKHNVISPRSCNTIQIIEDMVVKSSRNSRFSGEIYFYEHAPKDIQHMLPKFIKSEVSDDGIMTLRIERIRGITCSHLVTSRCLTDGRFKKMLTCLKEFHDSAGANESFEIDIYANYSQKLSERYHAYADVYEKLGTKKRLNDLYRSILEYLNEYQKGDRALPAKVIHGDTVFSNIILTNDGQCKFIDMRGAQGSTLTLQGDKMYDFAKIYQSLWGYDFVLIDRYPLDRRDVHMLSHMREVFRQFVQKEYQVQKFRDIEMICASLLFSLIPLHDEENHQRTFLKMCETIVFPFGMEYGD